MNTDSSTIKFMNYVKNLIWYSDLWTVSNWGTKFKRGLESRGRVQVMV